MRDSFHVIQSCASNPSEQYRYNCRKLIDRQSCFGLDLTRTGLVLLMETDNEKCLSIFKITGTNGWLDTVDYVLYNVFNTLLAKYQRVCYKMTGLKQGSCCRR